MTAVPAEAASRVDVSGPHAVVRGTDVRVSQIASEYEHLGMSADEVVDAHPHLTLADVHAALAYFYERTEAIRAEWRESDARITALRRVYPTRVRRVDGAKHEP